MPCRGLLCFGELLWLWCEFYVKVGNGAYFDFPVFDGFGLVAFFFEADGVDAGGELVDFVFTVRICFGGFVVVFNGDYYPLDSNRSADCGYATFETCGAGA